jgi:hypothetical protein
MRERLKQEEETKLRCAHARGHVHIFEIYGGIMVLRWKGNRSSGTEPRSPRLFPGAERPLAGHDLGLTFQCSVEVVSTRKQRQQQKNNQQTAHRAFISRRSQV